MYTEENRRYPIHPLVGVGVVIIRNGKILLVKRKKDPGKGLWSIPGGLVRLGEKLEDAAKREVKEETGLTISIVRLIDVVDVIHEDQDGRIEYHYVLVDYLGEVANGVLRPGSDVDEVRWFKLEEIHEVQVTPSFAKLFNKLRSLMS
ncbi:MAG: hypothetical protein DRJ31_06185 [Candidatus Methanomethylicota archaeon]|uniref:Nudix hydrolase domain-containing protein n=1 Tax=Thermoproteota archaeon TaxID=2056631 RepID=A0A497ENM8_9CREN|nr:MAG: hypothetical protein DRJ31_06185 [Candidatus Verstraetearchaeota archaeon]RLE53334.1 MAG: hypothetical protein DRJ33_01395 [Candidatus Verstraetearchaeota archaeon]